MSDEFDGTDANQNEGGSLRKQLEAALGKLASLEPMLAEYQRDQRDKKLTETLKAKGVADDKLASAKAFYGSDDVSEDAVGNWLNTHKAVFGSPNGNQADSDQLNAGRIMDAQGGSSSQYHESGEATPRAFTGDPTALMEMFKLPIEEQVRLGIMPAEAANSLYSRKG